MSVAVAAVVLDCEWGFRGERLDCETAFEPVVLCAKVLPSNQDYSFWGQDDRLSLSHFIDIHRDHIFVAHSAAAEMKYLLRLGIKLPPRWFCTMAGFRVVHNRPGFLDASLVAALTNTGLAALIPAGKFEIRDKILHLAFDEADYDAVVEYCFSDVRATVALFKVIINKVDPVAMQYWADYLAAVARIELRGIPIDTGTLRRIVNNRAHVRDALRAKANLTASVYRADGSFCKRALFRWLKRAGIAWPYRKSFTTGQFYRPLDDDTLKMLQLRHPFIHELRQTRKTLRSLGKFGLRVDGRDRRHYPSIMPFRSVTGRNQPRKFIFGGPKWMRWLVVPPSSDEVLVYVDFSAQEIGIAASLSGDTAMKAMYASPDPHMTFAIMAGAAPATATKATHPQIRAIYKTVNLAVLYDQTEQGVSERLGITIDDAAEILRQHRSIYGTFHAWSSRVVAAAFGRRYATTKCGWRSRVPADSKPRTWSNFPIQATGADIMRVMTIGLDRQKVQIHAIIHDGWLLSCSGGQQADLKQAVEHARRFACDTVLDGFPLRIDWNEYDDRFQDEDGRAAWEFILSVLPKEELRVPAEF